MPAIIYKNAAKQRVPSVTTVLRQLGWSRDALMWWAWNEGREGRNYKEASAATIGTVVHAAIEGQLKGQPFEVGALAGLDDDERAQVQSSIDAWHRWREQSLLQPIASEVSLVSEQHQYGGTLDMCLIHKRRSILDIKTGKGIYPDALAQIRAYGQLWEEETGEPIEDYYILRLGKADGSHHLHGWPGDSRTMQMAWRVFESCMKLHGLHKELRHAV